jgi:hypothetical protein
LTVLPDQLLFFFCKGPFAWNGLFGIWVPVVVFSGFFIVNFVVLRQAIRRERLSIVALPAAPAAAAHGA